MSKLLLAVQCGDCKEAFLFARTSDYTISALSFNTTVLASMLRRYDWPITDGGLSHFCRECAGERAFQEQFDS